MCDTSEALPTSLGWPEFAMHTIQLQSYRARASGHWRTKQMPQKAVQGVLLSTSNLPLRLFFFFALNMTCRGAQSRYLEETGMMTSSRCPICRGF